MAETGKREYVMTTVTTPVPPEVAQQAAARTVDAVKIYGKGQTEVRALDAVTVDRDPSPPFVPREV